MPDGVKHNDELFPWIKTEKHDHVCHAEMNAILNSYTLDLSKCHLYTTLYPCNECAKLIIKCGFKKVFYAKKHPNFGMKFTVSEDMLKKNSVDNDVCSLEGNRFITFIPEKELKSSGVINWKHFFMGLAYLGKDLKSHGERKSGACLVNNDKRIVGVGYGNYCKISNEEETKKRKLSEHHAEISAILNSNSVNLKECILYTTAFPCKECAKVIAQKRIKKIVYLEENEDTEDAKAAKKNIISIKH